jgi:hypothetical protein
MEEQTGKSLKLNEHRLSHKPVWEEECNTNYGTKHNDQGVGANTQYNYEYKTMVHML